MPGKNWTSLDTVTIDTGGLGRIEGNTYAFLLDAFVGFDGIENSTNVLTNDNYVDGTFFHYGG
jgi:hypothetical protein